MIHMSLNRAATLLECGPPQIDVKFSGITSDSRRIAPGMLFAALSGETFDGHDYIKQAEECGAAAVLVCREVPRAEGYKSDSETPCKILLRRSVYFHRK